MQFAISSSEYVLITASALFIIFIAWIVYLQIRINRFLKGKNGVSLEDTIIHSQKEIISLRDFESNCLAYFTDVEKRLGRSVQAVETIRFNPFKGTGDGGNQSFSTAFVSERGDGIVITSLYSRDRISLFSKPISKFESEHQLSEEEQVAVQGAIGKLKEKK